MTSTDASLLVSYVRDSSLTNETDRLGGPIATVNAPVSEPVVMSESAVHIAAELRRIDTARRRGARATADRHIERLIDFVWFSGPDGAA